MTSKHDTYTVNCECHRWLPVRPEDAGSAVKCACGRRVEVPLLEEFQQRPDLLSATTVESRIGRLVLAGELPVVGRCARCDAASTEVLAAWLDCERSSVHSEGGFRFIYIPFLFWMTWQEEARIEVRGHDTAVPAPICVCGPCQEQLRQRRRLSFIWLPMLLIPVACVAAYFYLLAGLGVAGFALLAGILWAYLRRGAAIRERQRDLKEVANQVPVYRQMLASYPDAVVLIAAQR